MKNFFRWHRRAVIKWPVLDWVAIMAGIILVTIFTLPNLISASAYFDEGYSAYLAQQDLWTMALYTAMDVHPPLYYAALHFWQYIVGDGVAELRLLSLAFAWVAIVFGFLIVRRGFGRHAAWFAALIMGLSPLFIRYASSMRMYTMALAIILAATYVLMIALEKKKRWPWIVYGILVAAGMWTNYFTALIWAAHGAWLFYEYRRSLQLKTWAKSLGLAVILYLPWLPAFLYRAGEVQASGFWIKPLSIDTLVSTVTMSFVFRNAASTQSWLAVGIIAFVAGLFIGGRGAYQKLDKAKQKTFRLIGITTALPIILLAIASLPPLRPAYVYRYVLFASFVGSLLVAIVVYYARFKRHNTVKHFLFYALTVLIFASGAVHAMSLGNRNLDTDSQNKLAQVIADVKNSKYKAPIVVRSPYSYYAATLYSSKDHPVYFLYYSNLATIGSTKPLYDHPKQGVKSAATYDHVWLVGEDRNSVAQPDKNAWKLVDGYVEYDDVTKKPAAFAAYYERQR